MLKCQQLFRDLKLNFKFIVAISVFMGCLDFMLSFHAVTSEPSDNLVLKELVILLLMLIVTFL